MNIHVEGELCLLTLLSVLNVSFSLRTWPSTGLLCKDDCFKNEEDVSHISACCVCNSLASWEIEGSDSTPEGLSIRYNEDNAEIIRSVNSSNKNVTSLQHVRGWLKKMPGNVCHFSSIVQIDLRDNDLSEVGNISCIRHLEKLILKGNKITKIGKSDFVGLKKMRTLDLSFLKLHRLYGAMDFGIK